MITEQQDIDRVLALVARHARHFARDPLDAEDLAQIVLIKAWRAWKQKPEMREWNDTQLSAWLWQITSRAWIDEVRKRACHPCATGLADAYYATGDVESDVERRSLLTSVLSHIDEKERVVVLLRARGYTYEEIAASQHITRNAVAHRLMRGKQAFKKEWERVAA